MAAVLWLALLHVLYPFTEASRCVEVKWEDRYCCDITCAEGEEPVPCYFGDKRSATCRVCPEGTFSASRSKLGEKCKLRTVCLKDHMVVKFAGTPTEDAMCGCEPGYSLSYFTHTCYRVAPVTTTPRATEDRITPAPLTTRDLGDNSAKSPTSVSQLPTAIGFKIMVFAVTIAVAFRLWPCLG